MRENDKSKNDRCGFYFHSLNRICSGTTEIERWIRENDISGNDRSRFHCTPKKVCTGRLHPFTMVCTWYCFHSSVLHHVLVGRSVNISETSEVPWNVGKPANHNIVPSLQNGNMNEWTMLLTYIYTFNIRPKSERKFIKITVFWEKMPCSLAHR
jgi:hypothetical protein